MGRGEERRDRRRSAYIEHHLARFPFAFAAHEVTHVRIAILRLDLLAEPLAWQRRLSQCSDGRRRGDRCKRLSPLSSSSSSCSSSSESDSSSRCRACLC